MSKNNFNKEEFEITIDKSALQNSAIEDLLYYQDLKNRKLFLGGEIDASSAFEISRQILQYNKEDKGVPIEERKPIRIYVSSVGGSVIDGCQIIDIIKASKTPVYTICLGYSYSMAFLITLAGHKRFANPNSTFLLHDGSSMVYNSAGKAQDQMQFHLKIEDTIKKYILDNTNITAREFSQKSRVEWYMFAEEAKKKGVIDYIIGIDCTIDDIL